MDVIQTEPAQGLTSAEAVDRLARFGLNDPAPARGRSGVVQLLALFVNPLIIILMIAALVFWLSRRRGGRLRYHHHRPAGGGHQFHSDLPIPAGSGAPSRSGYANNYGFEGWQVAGRTAA